MAELSVLGQSLGGAELAGRPSACGRRCKRPPAVKARLAADRSDRPPTPALKSFLNRHTYAPDRV